MCWQIPRRWDAAECFLQIVVPCAWPSLSIFKAVLQQRKWGVKSSPIPSWEVALWLKRWAQRAWGVDQFALEFLVTEMRFGQSRNSLLGGSLVVLLARLTVWAKDMIAQVSAGPHVSTLCSREGCLFRPGFTGSFSGKGFLKGQSVLPWERWANKLTHPCLWETLRKQSLRGVARKPVSATLHSQFLSFFL